MKWAIRAGREGLYPETIEADVPEERLKRFFSREHGREVLIWPGDTEGLDLD
jgi:chemotaxis methyl-accepting protein methylase